MTPALRRAVAGIAALIVLGVGLVLWISAGGADNARSEQPEPGRARHGRLSATMRILPRRQPRRTSELARAAAQRTVAGSAPRCDGHTWHHSDKQLFERVKHGIPEIVPGCQTDMPK